MSELCLKCSSEKVAADGVMFVSREWFAVAKDAVALVKHYREREQHFARALAVADGGQYRADWDGAIRNVLADLASERATREQLDREVARLRRALKACWLEMQWAGARLDCMPDDYAEAMRIAGIEGRKVTP